MEMRAYSEDYLSQAQRILGDMLDYAVNTYEMNEDAFWGMFIASGIAEQFGNGNPAYVAGVTGCELVKKVFRESGVDVDDLPEEMYLDRSPEYWVKFWDAARRISLKYSG